VEALAGNITICPFQIVIDSREKAPYSFTNLPARASGRGKGLVVPVETKLLYAGDYSIVGEEISIACERKSLEDLFSTLGQNRARFEREIDRLQGYQVAAVVIEASWQEICRPRETRGEGWRSKLSPRSVWATIFSWSQKYPNVHWWTAGSRRLGEVMTFEILERFWREHGR